LGLNFVVYVSTTWTDCSFLYGIKCPLSRTYAVFLFHKVVSQIEDFSYLIVDKVVRVPGYDLSEFIDQEQGLQRLGLIVAGQKYCLVDLLRCRISYWVEFYSPRGGVRDPRAGKPRAEGPRGPIPSACSVCHKIYFCGSQLIVGLDYVSCRSSYPLCSDTIMSVQGF